MPHSPEHDTTKAAANRIGRPERQELSILEQLDALHYSRHGNDIKPNLRSARVTLRCIYAHLHTR